MSEWMPVRKLVHDYNKARCHITPVRGEDGKVNHWLSGLGMKGKPEDRYDPAYLKSLRDEHRMWRRFRETHTQTAIAKQCGVSVVAINKVIIGRNKTSEKFDVQAAIEKYNHWLGVDKKHSPTAVCARESLSSTWYDNNVMRAVRLEDMK